MSNDYIIDFISGHKVKATPEEIEAVQVFSKRLVEEFEYDRTYIQTRPQFKIKQSPSGKAKYPVDIAVFKNDSRNYEDLFMIVECKRKTREDGLKQLKIYMGLSSAQIGVWYNGKDHIYIHKILDKHGNVSYKTLPNIPKQNQRIEDIGRFKRKDLKKPSNLKAIFNDIRNHLAGMTTGITRDETLARELINLLFCKIYDELNTPPEQEVAFRAGVNEDPKVIKERINKLFEDKVKKDEYEDVFDSTDNITLDPESLYYVVGELQNYCISEAERDAIADAFEVFIGPALRGPEGQFFTPRNVIKMMVEIIDPNAREMIIDPACGSGGFLIVALEHVWRKLDIEAAEKRWSRERRRDVKRDVARKFFRGIDKDSFLTKVTKAYMALIGDGRGGIFCENALRRTEEWQPKARDAIQLGKFDVLLTNPPFGSKIPVKGDAILGQYSLGHEWKKSKDTEIWEQTQKTKEKKPPQILFIERSLQLLREGGRMGIVLPETIFGNPSHGYILKYLLENIKIIGIVSMPEELFQPYTHAKTCVVFIEKTKPNGDYPIFMSVVRWCGHDSRGNQIPHDEVPQISTRYYELMQAGSNEYNRLGFIKRLSDLKSHVLIPKYYDPDIDIELNKLSEHYDLIRFDDFVNRGILEVSTGHEIGKLSYSTGSIPFIRSSDISNWELKIDPKQRVSKDIFNELKDKQDVKEYDILFVRDGTYLIGTTCMITKYNTEILYQSHIYKIRSLDHKSLSPYLLLAVLNSPIVKRQIRSKQFTQDIIDTLGNRLMELVLPIPKDKEFRDEIERETKFIIEQRAELRQKTLAIPLKILRKEKLTEDEEKIINE